ncbi:hypothetical protein F5Y12DRAFT_777863 [Xylaria sp. FL1777]|nr:hypothetical protein F5Y12DRAFT_777863 [Xylaria sp. FL1777]
MATRRLTGLTRTALRLRPSTPLSSLSSLSFTSPTPAIRPLRRPRTTRQVLQPHIRHASTFQSGPSPPRLPPGEQAEFERLQRTASTQEGFNATSSPDFSSSSHSSSIAVTATTTTTTASSAQETPVLSEDLDTAQSIPLRKGAPPEFEGDVNPRTGEVGGPKNEPLRWGPAGDYSFNGRVTDF